MNKLIALIVIIGLFGLGCCGTTQSNTYSGSASSAKEDLVILEHNLTREGSAYLSVYYIEGVAQNVAGHELSYASVEARFFDKDGNQLDTSSDSTSDLAAGATWKFKIPYFGNEEVARYEIKAGTSW